MAENGKNLRLGLVIEAIDKASSVFERINERIERIAAPANRAGIALRKLYETSRLGELRERFDKVGEGIERVQRRAQNLFNLEAYVGVAGGAIFELTKRVAENSEQVEHLSQRLGISTRDVQRLGYAAKQSGGDLNSFGEMMGFLNRNVVDAQKGNKELLQLFHAIGISSQDLRKDSPVELLYKISDWFEKFPNKAREGYVSMMLLGRGSQESVPLLQKGSKGLKDLGDEAERLGLTNKEGFENAEKFNSSLTRMNKAVGGLVNRLGADLLPGMTKLFDRITSISSTRPKFFEDLSARLGDIVEQLPDILRSFLQLFGVLSALLGIATKVADAFGGWAHVIELIAAVRILQLLAAVAQLFAALTLLGAGAVLNPLLLTLGAIAVAFLLIYKNWDKLSKLTNLGAVQLTHPGSIRFGSDGLPVSATTTPSDLIDQINGGTQNRAPLIVPPLSTRAGPLLNFGPAAPTIGAAHAEGKQRVDVGGELRIAIDSNGRARVQTLKARGGMNLSVANGPLSAALP